MTGTLLISQNALHRADEDLFLNADFVLFQGVITRGKTLDGGRVADKCYVWAPRLAGRQYQLQPLISRTQELQGS